MRLMTLASTILAWLLVSSVVAGDWLVSLEGHLTETRGPWEIDGETLLYTDLAGESLAVPLAEIDLEASEETTAMRAGKEYVPSAAALAQRRKLEQRETGGRVEEGESPIILYTRWRCGPCKEAEEYLERLGARFTVKDEDARRTQRELRKKAGKKYILPVLDVDGEIVIGFRREEIRRLVERYREEETGSDRKR